MPRKDNADRGPWGAPPPIEEDHVASTGPATGGAGSRRASQEGGPPLSSPLASLRRRFAAGARWLADRRWSGRDARVAIGAVVLIAPALWLASGLYFVPMGEAAVVTRMGRLTAVVGAGVHWRWPVPMGAVKIVPETRGTTTVIGAGAQDGGRVLARTADGDLVSVAFSVDWRVRDPRAWATTLSEPQGYVEAAAVAAMRQALGSVAFADLPRAASKVERNAAERTGEALDAAGLGAAVEAVRLISIAPPPAAAAAFDDVAQAREDARAAAQSAAIAGRQGLAQAQARAAQGIAEAQASRAAALAQAEAQAKRFDAAYAQYRADPASAEQRLWLDTVTAVLAKSHKIIVEAHGVSLAPGGPGGARVLAGPGPAPPARAR